MDQIKNVFTAIGGEFLSAPEEISRKLERINTFMFDWDGVFNTGEKTENGSSNFSEVDSMGTNMLRFSYWLQHQKLPNSVIISGERNQASFAFSEREHFTSCYYKVADKLAALNHFCEQHQVKNQDIAYIFDDVLDLSLARTCGLRILVQRKANPLFNRYVKNNHLADYVTASESGQFAVRESCELLIGLSGRYDETISNRTEFTETYRSYVDTRNRITTGFFTSDSSVMIEQHPGK